MDGLREESTSVATRKQHLAAIRHFFDNLVTHSGWSPATRAYIASGARSISPGHATAPQSNEDPLEELHVTQGCEDTG